MFAENGYEATTVEDIAAAAGLSHMTFFRYFPRKEDVVEYDEYDPLLAELVATRPREESPLEALHGALRSGLEAVMPSDAANVLARTRLLLSTPALRNRNWIAQDTTIDVFATASARRVGLPEPDYGTRVLAAAALGALNVAITSWAQSDDADLMGVGGRCVRRAAGFLVD